MRDGDVVDEIEVLVCRVERLKLLGMIVPLYCIGVGGGGAPDYDGDLSDLSEILMGRGNCQSEFIKRVRVFTAHLW